MAVQKGTVVRPNIVFIPCDNIGWGDFSCYSGSIPPPQIDKRRTPPSTRPIRRALACTRT
jgi:arylsulfatase A-like enzyme